MVYLLSPQATHHMGLTPTKCIFHSHHNQPPLPNISYKVVGPIRGVMATASSLTSTFNKKIHSGYLRNGKINTSNVIRA